MSPGRATAPPGSASAYFHVLVRRNLFRDARSFNLNETELLNQFVKPWRQGERVLLDGRAWDPVASKLTIYEGPRLSTQQRSFGQGWLNAVKFGEDVTEEMLNGRPVDDELKGGEGSPHIGPAASRRHPTLWGHLHHIPSWMATAADVITVVSFLVAAMVAGAKLVGAW